MLRLANEELTFSGNVSVSDLGDGYTVVAFIKSFRPYWLLQQLHKKLLIFQVLEILQSTATADEMSQAVIQYGFAVNWPFS